MSGKIVKSTGLEEIDPVSARSRFDVNTYTEASKLLMSRHVCVYMREISLH